MLNNHILDFNNRLIGLRDFVELIEPFLTQKVEEHNKHLHPLILPGLLKEVLKSEKEWEEGLKEKTIELHKSLEKNLIEKYNEIPEVKVDEIKSKEEKALRVEIKSSNPTITKHISNVHKTKKHIELLYTNSLISVLSSVEWYFSQLLHFYYSEHPSSAGVQKKTLTLSELKTFLSIEDAEKFLIDSKIEEILRGNFESWISLLKNELSLSMGYLKDMNDELTEIYQRRNLFVHNGGVVNSIYLSKVKDDFLENITVGSKLEVDKSYLDNAICKLQKTFILIGAELWKKLAPDDETRGDILGDIVYENLLHSRWEISSGICFFIIKDANLSPVDKVVAQLNYWLCQKEMGNYSSIEKELNQIDFSDKKEIFQLALLALRMDKDKFFELLPKVLKAKQINIERLEEFPIFKEMRETEEYATFKSESEYFKIENQDIEKLKTVEKE